MARMARLPTRAKKKQKNVCLQLFMIKIYLPSYLVELVIYLMFIDPRCTQKLLPHYDSTVQ